MHHLMDTCFLLYFRYFASGAPVKVAQGVSGAVIDKGSLRRYLRYLIQGVKQVG